MIKTDKLPRVVIKESAIHGQGLFAAEDIAAGTLIGEVRGRPSNKDGAYVLWVDGVDGFEVTCDLKYINHSDTPNACYYDTLEVCAINDIKSGEEITHDYEGS